MSLTQRLVFAYLQAVTQKPIETKLKTTTITTITANVISQTLIEGTPLKDFDFKRLRKVLLSCLVLCVVRHYQFKLLNRLIPPAKAGPFQILQQLLLDQLIFAPINQAFFFILMSLQSNLQADIPGELQQKLLPSLKMYWRVWPVAKLFSLNFVPVPLRPLFGDLIGFFWSIFLSGMTKSRLSRR